MLVLGGHLGVLPLASEETYVSLVSLDGALELLDSPASGGKELFGCGRPLADGVHQSPGDGAGGFADVSIVGDAEEGCGGPW